MSESQDKQPAQSNRQQLAALRLPIPGDDTELKGYRWPASRITKADMIRLTELRERTGRRITVLLHEAVTAYHRLFTETPEPPNGPRCCENPRLQWKSESASNCYIECLFCGFILCDDGQLADWHDPEQIAWESDMRRYEESGIEMDKTKPVTPSPIAHGQGTSK